MRKNSKLNHAAGFKNFLIVRTDRIGDVILTLPLAHILKQRFPDSQITMLIRQYTSELVSDSPDVDQIIYYDQEGGLKPFFSLLREIYLRRFDTVIHTYPRARVAFLAWLALIPVRVGTGFRYYSVFFNRKVYEHRRGGTHHELEYNLRLIEKLGIRVDDADRRPVLPVSRVSVKKVAQMLDDLGLSGNEKLIILHPGSKGSSKDWPPENFGSLGKRLSEIPGVRIAVTGNSDEEGLVGSVCRSIGAKAVEICGKVGLGDLGALAARASIFVSNSTGPIHIAAAVGTFVIGFYPQIPHMSAKRWGPYTDKKVIFSPKDKPLDCKKCSKERGGCECMDSIRVDEVFECIKNILDENKV